MRDDIYDTAAERIRSNSLGAIFTVVGIVALAAFLFGGGFARAADLTPTYKAPVTPRVVAADDWSKFYLGADVGYGLSDFKSDTILGIGDAFKASPKGGAFGGFAGRNWRAGSFVASLEVRGIWLGKRDTNDLVVDGEPVGISTGAKLDALGTVRARLGVLPFGDSTLLYVAAGPALGHSESQVTLGAGDPKAVTASGSAVSFGWNVGGGVEFKLNSALSVRLDYTYWDLGKTSYTYNSGGVFLPIANTSSLTTQTLMLGVAAHF